jgi:hypothetical protein
MLFLSLSLSLSLYIYIYTYIHTHTHIRIPSKTHMHAYAQAVEDAKKLRATSVQIKDLELNIEDLRRQETTLRNDLESSNARIKRLESDLAGKIESFESVELQRRQLESEV